MTELGWSLIILAATAVGSFFVFSWGPVMRVVKSQKPPPPPPEVATRQLRNRFRLVIAVVLLFIALPAVEYGALILAPTNKLGYFLKYSTPGGQWNVASWDQVFISPRPHDCEWDTAPLGSKHCHYDPVVRTVRTKANENGQLMVSYDEGNTLQVANGEQPAIYVAWQRVEE